MRKTLKRTAFAALLLSLAMLVAASAALAQAPGDPSLPSLTDDLGSWAALVGIVLPPLAALLQRDHWADWINAVIFGAAVVVASVVYGFIRYRANFTWEHWEAALLAIVVWGLFTYKMYWRPGSNSVVNKLRGIPAGGN